MQLFHHLFSDGAAPDLSVTHLLDALFYAVRERFGRRGADGPFLARLRETGKYFRPVERLSSPVFLDHDRQTLFHPLVGGVAALAGEALAATADDPTLPGHS